MKNVTVDSTEPVSRRHNVGNETFYVEIIRRAELSPDLMEIRESQVKYVSIYLGDGAGESRREMGHNQRVDVTVEMAQWLRDALDRALQEDLQTRMAFEDNGADL